jgi:hypothetical protein
LRPRGRGADKQRGGRDHGAEPDQLLSPSSLSFHRSCSPVSGSRG